ncbi:T9SS type A sorting domain-containing protein, partial [Ichthyenterobacterium sp. W332]
YMFEYKTNVTVELFDAKGILVSSQTNNSYVKGSDDSTNFDMSRLSNQMYYVKVTTSRGTMTKKIVSGN